MRRRVWQKSQMTLFVNGIHPTIDPIVSSFQKSQLQKEVTFSNLMIRTRVQGCDYSASTEYVRVVRAVKAGNCWNLQSMEFGASQTSGHSTVDEGVRQLPYASEHSMATGSLLATIEDSRTHLNQGEEETQLLYAGESPRRLNQARTVQMLKFSHVRRLPDRFRQIDRNTIAKKTFISLSDYEEADLILPSCIHGLYGTAKVRSIYEAQN